MISALRDWIDHRIVLRRQWQADAGALIVTDECGAYYEAQRRAFTARARGDKPEVWHWSKTAAEVARRSAATEMDLDVVQAIADEAYRLAPAKQPRR